MRYILLIFVLVLVGSGAQSQISTEILAAMPIKTANNAIASVEVDGNWFVYSFSGIDSTKNHNGIHSRCFKYDLGNDVWSEIDELPGGQDRIAAGASTVRGKIYILGGYEVFSNGGEVSIDLLHVYDPVADTFEVNAAPIPTPIDDQVQIVYKDSLIYSITGWSDFGNVGDVWIYDVVEKEWREGTNIPTTPAFKAFGASGAFIGDTIYYIGGAQDFGSFPIGDRLRKGYINPQDPTDITWEISTFEEAKTYRAGAGVFNGSTMQAFWLGGSENTYNYNGIAYNGQGGVAPTNRVVFYDPLTGKLNNTVMDFPPIMDLRGLVQIGANSYLTAGGMQENQEVTNRVVRYEIDQLVYTKEKKYSSANFLFYPNPTNGRLLLDLGNLAIENGAVVSVVDLQGLVVYNQVLTSNASMINIELSLPAGSYILRLIAPDSNPEFKRFVILD